MEIVQDNTTLAPYPRKEKVTERLWKNLFGQGILACGSTGLAGIHGDTIIYGPPFIINEEQILFMADVLAKAVDNVLET